MIKKIINLIFVLLIGCCCFAELMKDDFVDSTLKQQYTPAPNTHTIYNYKSTQYYPIKLSILKEIKSELDVYEGQTLSFEVKEHVIHNNKIIIEAGTPVTARIETITKSGMNGIPASIIIGDFKIKNIEKGQLTEFYEIEGQDRSVIVFPLKWALTILPPSGSLTNFIKGGHAKIKTKKTIIIYYHPNWI